MENGTIVFVRAPYGDEGMSLLWPGWVVGSEGSETLVQTTDADGRRREVVRAPSEFVRELAPLASPATPRLAFAREERALMRVSAPDPFAEAVGYDLRTSLHDVPEGTATAMCRAYAGSLSGGPAVGGDDAIAGRDADASARSRGERRARSRRRLTVPRRLPSEVGRPKRERPLAPWSPQLARLARQ
jgi:hypothetical protein